MAKRTPARRSARRRTPLHRARAGAWLVSALMLGLVVLLALHARRYWPFLSDDALISFRYAERLASGDGLTWTDGERVEGYSDLLWVLLLGALHLPGIPTIPAARALDFFGAVVGIVLVSSAARPFRLQAVRQLSGGLALALAAPVAVWAIGGLEHGAMIGTLAAALLLSVRAVGPTVPRWGPLLRASAALGALVLFRIDGFVLAGAIGVGALLSLRPWRAGRLKSAARAVALLAVVPAGCLLTQQAFRFFYYGALVPNTAVAKVSINADRLWLGLRHVGTGLGATYPMVLLALGVAAAAWHRAPRGRLGIPLTVAFGWSSYLIVVGGDIFPGWRQLLLALVALAMVLAEGMAVLVRRHGLLGLGALSALVLGFGFSEQLRDSENLRAQHERWEWDGLAIGHLIRTTVGDRRPLLAVDAAGALPYWSGVPSLDMLGLNDSYIAHHPPPSFGRGGIGHELGDGAYVLRRRPDIIAFNNAAGHRTPLFLSGRQMVQRAEFRRLYQLVPVVGQIGNRARGDLYLLREGGKLSIVRDEAGLEIPGWFFASDAARATVGERGRLVTPVTDAVPGELPPIDVPAGTYRLEAEPAAAQLRIGVRCPQVSPDALSGEAAVVELESAQRLRIIVAPPASEKAEVEQVRLVRVTGVRAGRRCSRSRPNAPVEVTLASVARPKAPGTYWAAPDNVVMGQAGVRVRLPAPRTATQVELSLDSNDAYRVRFLRDGVEQGQGRVSPDPASHDLRRAQVSVPEAARDAGFDAIEVIPNRGDGSYSLGHLVLR